MGWFWNHIPNFDGQTLFTFVVGTIVTLLTFWIGYKKTIGAQEERSRAVNQELAASVLRRVAVEKELMEATQYDQIKTAKSYSSSVALSKLITFELALSLVLSDIIDNDFLDAASKKSVIELIDQSRETQARHQEVTERSKPETALFGTEISLLFLSVLSVGFGLVASLIFKSTQSAWDAPLVGNGKNGLVALTAIAVISVSALALSLSAVVARRNSLERALRLRKKDDVETKQ